MTEQTNTNPEFKIELSDCYTLQDKRLYTDYWFEFACPSCGCDCHSHFNQRPLLYCPDTYSDIGFYCEQCEHEETMFNFIRLEDVEGHNTFAVLTKSENFGEMTLMKLEPIKHGVV